mmetsp:Transcript_20767/g.35665  ORF Transcript_20767/g.35665 Transcript_20767/m.35665 type:complete len:101 (-) Transcript_20767:23-325(-)
MIGSSPFRHPSVRADSGYIVSICKGDLSKGLIILLLEAVHCPSTFPRNMHNADKIWIAIEAFIFCRTDKGFALKSHKLKISMNSKRELNEVERCNQLHKR